MAVSFEYTNVPVTDGSLSVAITRGSIDNPLLCGLEVIYSDSNQLITPTMMPTIAPGEFPSVPTEIPSVISSIRLSCGSDSSSYSYEDSNGNIWIGDSNYVVSSDSVVGLVTNLISNTNDDDIYQSYRFESNSGNLEYLFSGLYNSPSVTYTVRLHFAETELTDNDVNSRMFGIEIEGVEMIEALDLVSSYGSDTAAMIEFTQIGLIDGSMTITLVREINDMVICGIEIIAQISNNEEELSQSILTSLNSIHINSGGFTLHHIDSNGFQWIPDRYLGDNDGTGTETISTTNSVTTLDDSEVVYQNGRISSGLLGSVSYEIEGNGVFDVELVFAEIVETSSGSRVMDVIIEGSTETTAFDIFDSAGQAANIPVSLTYSNVPVQDGTVNIVVTATTGKALICGVIVSQTSDHFAHSVITVGMLCFVLITFLI